MSLRPRVIALTGPPASGKSTVGMALAGEMGLAVLDQDSLTNPLMDVIVALVGASGYADPRAVSVARAARYDCVFRGAEDAIRAGTGAVMIAPFTDERRDPQAWEALAGRMADAGGEATLVWIRLDRDELRQRMVARAAERDAAKLEDVEAYLDTVDLAPPLSAHVEIDGSLPSDRQVAQLRAAVFSG